MTAKRKRRGAYADRIEVAEKTAAGYSERYVAHELDLHHSFVRRWARHFHLYGHVGDQPRSGRPRRRTSVFIERVRDMFARDDTKSIRDVAAELEGEGEEVSAKTVQRAAHDAGLYPYRQPRKPLLTAAHRHARLAFATRHRGTDWQRVLFVDETARALHAAPNPQNDRRWVPKGTRVESVPRVQATTSVKVCAGVAAGGKTRLHLYSGGMDADDYQRVLKKTLLPDGDKIFGDGDWWLLHDRAPYHAAASVVEYLNDSQHQHLTEDWPPHSPDLNVIENVFENVWGILKHNVRLRFASNKKELDARVRAEWRRIPQQQIDNMINSMPERMRAVVAARGGHTRY